MSNLFGGFEVALRALSAHRTALSVRGNNAANASTPGYARQRAELRSVGLSALGDGGFRAPRAQGVDVVSVERLADPFLDGEARRAAAELAAREEAARVLGEVEAFLGGPADPGVEEAFDALWAAFQDLSVHPESLAVRASLLERASTFCDRVRQLERFLSDLESACAGRAEALVEEVNSLAGRVAALNAEVVRARAAGQDVPHVLDERDRALDRLAELVGARSVERPDGSVAVVAGNGVLVSGGSVGPLAARDGAVVWERSGARAAFESGQLAGLEEAVSALRDLAARADAVIRGLASGVNAVHRRGCGLDGSTGLDFFAGSGAADLEVNPALAPEKVAAASSPAALPGDPSVAVELARTLDRAPVLGGVPFRDAWRSLASSLGVRVAGLKAAADAARAVSDHVAAQRDQVRGVWLDEEAVWMAAHARAAEAASRYFTTVDEVVKAVLEMGVAGR